MLLYFCRGHGLPSIHSLLYIMSAQLKKLKMIVLLSLLSVQRARNTCLKACSLHFLVGVLRLVGEVSFPGFLLCAKNFDLGDKRSNSEEGAPPQVHLMWVANLWTVLLWPYGCTVLVL
ncbi:hypothetical protein GOP47_0006663 [Adiantum capillus-veneris]|uniref:Uncharacterized protein n=1 Tax=Adiantum capillus-veneris TaxID=13818 RepID=A0A9D4V429_ADICA|nr:hypothetical protein GOP47_0006663 [Adiantum capillus-veneris]